MREGGNESEPVRTTSGYMGKERDGEEDEEAVRVSYARKKQAV